MPASTARRRRCSARVRVWTADPATQAYISTCQASKVGDTVSKDFLEGLTTASLISQGDDAFNAGSYQTALDLYSTAKRSPYGDQLKAYNGVYLSYLRMNQEAQAANAFGEAVGYGLKRNRLAVKFLFQPGSTQFYQDQALTGQYPVWLQQIATQSAQFTAKANDCIEVSEQPPAAPARRRSTSACRCSAPST